MSPVEDARYFARRAKQSHMALAAATDRGSRVAHAQLASAYEAKVSSPVPRHGNSQR